MEKVSQYIIDKICQENLITTFLDKKGINYVHKYKERYIYLCPLHKDSAPSFIVYDKLGEYQNYYCFGCGQHGNFLSLFSKLNNISYSEALKKVYGEIEISNDEELDFLIRKMKVEESAQDEGVDNVFSEISLDISSLGKLHLERVEKDKDEVLFLDHLYQKIDKHVEENNIQALCQIYDFLQDGDDENGKIPPFQIRLDKWNAKIEQKLKLQLQGTKS